MLKGTRWRWWQWLGLGLVLLVLAAAGTSWLLLTRYAEPWAQREIRRLLTDRSALALGPFEVTFSVVRDFPYPTATLRHLALSDTARGRTVPVLQVGELTMRLAARELLHRRVQVTRLVVRDVLLHQEVDALGQSWGLRGKKRPGSLGHSPAFNLAVDSVMLHNFRLTTHNRFIGNGLNASVYQARLALAVQGGALRVRGHFVGSLDELSVRTGTLLAHEPVQGRVHYEYAFEPRQGRIFDDTRATLNGDTITIAGTHHADTVQANGVPRGTWFDMRFSGNQPLVEVLRMALPPSVRHIMSGATSPSKAQLVYTITGLSGPRVRPHTNMKFGLRGASIQWPDSARHIDHWDLQATYDNGPAHDYPTMSVRFDQCRVSSSVGQLDASFVVRNFRRPYVDGHLHGRTELATLAVLLPRTRWRAPQGIADLNVRLRGPLPAPGPRQRGPFQLNLAMRGTATIHDATLQLTHHSTALRHLNVQIGLHDSLWQLNHAAGTLGDGMRFQASATTVNLLRYFTGQSPTTQVTGEFAANELDLGQLRELLQRHPSAPLRHPPRTAAERRQLAATLGSSLIPAGLRLDVGLHLGRLALATDTLHDLAVRVRHNGHEVQLSDIRARLWDGQVQGQVHWPTDSANDVAPVMYDIDFKFDTINYKHLLTRLSRPPRHSARHPASPAVRELLLAANGHLSYSINTVALPNGEALRNVQVQLDKDGSALSMPELRFTAPQGGQGEGSGMLLLDGLHIAATDATLDLHYQRLDIARLMQMLASVAPPVTDSARAGRHVLRQARQARRAARNGGKLPASLLTNGQFTAQLRIEADQMRYGAISGSSFRLISRLREGEVLLDAGSLDALGGHIALHGRLLTNGGRQHHPLEVQALAENIQLSQLFGTLTALNFNVLTADNIRGTLRTAAVLHTDLGPRFLPTLDRTTAYLKTDLHDLELRGVEALEDVLKIVKRRTSHLYFEPVSSEFVFDRGQLLIPALHLDSNLTEMQVSGRYNLDGRANLFIGLNPVHALLGNNRKRIARIQAGEEVNRRESKLTYVNLRREQPRTKYQMRLFQKAEQRQQQAVLRRQSHELIITQRLDTTLKPPPPVLPMPAPTAADTAP